MSAGRPSKRLRRRRSEESTLYLGCTNCVRKGLYCDSNSSPCDTCLLAGELCTFDGQINHTPATEILDPFESSNWPSSSHSNGASSSYFPPVSSEDNSDTEAASERPGQSLSSIGTDVVSHYMSKFDQYNYQLCAWTNLLALPRRSVIPTILTIPARRGKKTNWATFFLPHLSLGTAEDSLSIAIAAFTALRMEHFATASELYLRAIALLRIILMKKNASSMDNLAYLRLWSTVLLLTEYEAQLGNQDAQWQHLAGATTLSEGAEYRFPRLTGPAQGVLNQGFGVDSEDGSQSSGEHKSALISPALQTLTRTERDLPSYLMALNRRLEHAKAIRLSCDTHWPSFYTPADRESLGILHDKCSELYRIVMPPVGRYYETIALAPPNSAAAHARLLSTFTEEVKRARAAIRDYQAAAIEIYGTDNKVYQSCAKPGFPFSPIIKFVDPQMAQPSSVPYMFLIFMAPFISVEEHRECVRHMSGVFAGFQDNVGLLIDASFPDIHVAAFWRKGLERDYFADEMQRRGGDFAVLLKRIWGVIDYVQMTQGGRELSPTTILGISLREYRNAQAQGMRLKNTRH